MPWLARVRQEGHPATRVVTPRLSPEGIKSEASWVQLGYLHARAVPLAPGYNGHGKNARWSAFPGHGPCDAL